MKRQNHFDGTEVGPGYCRAVRVGPHVHVSGTTSLDPKRVCVGGPDVYLQTKETLRKIGEALKAVDADFKDVVRLVGYITDIREAEGYMRGVAEVVGGIDPAGTLVEVSALMTPDLKVEIEAYAIIAE